MAGETCSPAPSQAGRGRIDPLSRSERRPQSLKGSAGRAAPRGCCGAAPPRSAAQPRAGAARAARAQSCARCRPQLSRLLPGKLRRRRRRGGRPGPALPCAGRRGPARGAGAGGPAERSAPTPRSGAERSRPPSRPARPLPGAALRGRARSGAPPRRGLGAGRLPQVSVRRRRCRAPPARSCSLAPSPAAWAESY